MIVPILAHSHNKRASGNTSLGFPIRAECPGGLTDIRPAGTHPTPAWSVGGSPGVRVPLASRIGPRTGP